jgi:hypothetical protein
MDRPLLETIDEQLRRWLACPEALRWHALIALTVLPLAFVINVGTEPDRLWAMGLAAVWLPALAAHGAWQLRRAVSRSGSTVQAAPEAREEVAADARSPRDAGHPGPLHFPEPAGAELTALEQAHVPSDEEIAAALAAAASLLERRRAAIGVDRAMPADAPAEPPATKEPEPAMATTTPDPGYPSWPAGGASLPWQLWPTAPGEPSPMIAISAPPGRSAIGSLREPDLEALFPPITMDRDGNLIAGTESEERFGEGGSGVDREITQRGHDVARTHSGALGWPARNNGLDIRSV